MVVRERGWMEGESGRRILARSTYHKEIQARDPAQTFIFGMPSKMRAVLVRLSSKSHSHAHRSLLWIHGMYSLVGDWKIC